MSDQSATDKASKFIFSDLTWAMLMLRLWLGLRLLFLALNKFKKVNETDKSITWSLGNYYGEGGEPGWVDYASKPFYEYGGLPKWMAEPYTASLGWVMLLGGILILLGVTNRIAILFGTLIFLSLSFGLMTLDDGMEIAYVGFQFGLFIAALLLARHNRFMVFGKF